MGYVGKWHVSPDYTPLDFGYDDYIPESSHLDHLHEKYPGLQYREPFLGEPDPLPPVSYTHLDVYKRQPLSASH